MFISSVKTPFIIFLFYLICFSYNGGPITDTSIKVATYKCQSTRYMI